MTSRRNFVQGALALSGLTAATFAGGFARPLPTRTDSRPWAARARVVVDRTLPAAAAFAAEARRRGAAVAVFDSDIGWLWMNEIEPLWRRGPAAIAGLTTRSTLFCLEVLARDYGMRVVRSAPPAGDRAASSVSWLLTPNERLRPSLSANAASLHNNFNVQG